MPPTLLKTIGYIESALAQAASSVPWGATGPTLISFDCGHGIMQITSGMTAGHDAGFPSGDQALIATHYLYNIARGSTILAEKWNYAPEARPLAGTDTNSTPRLVENWYYALWSYNGFTGPGANRSNHPRDPIYAAWPRTGFSCGPSNDGYGHSYGNYPYQEIVYGCMARPPSVNGVALWQRIPATLPNLNDPRWRNPLSLSNFTASDGFARMDMPSPAPAHRDTVPEPAAGAASYMKGAPRLSVSRTIVSGQTNTVTISNVGTGILAWRAKPGQSWVSVNRQGGVALSPGVPCSPGASCERNPALTITSQNGRTGWVDIENLLTGQKWRVSIVNNAFDVNCDGSTNALDAAFILQFSARTKGSLPCGHVADANRDGSVNAVDAVLILQLSAGLS
jgi:hypothetical protein